MTRLALAINSVLIVLYATFGLAGTAHAYLDPGTGSFVLQMLVAGLLGALLYIKLAWVGVKAFFQGLFSRGSKQRAQTGDAGDEET